MIRKDQLKKDREAENSGFEDVFGKTFGTGSQSRTPSDRSADRDSDRDERPKGRSGGEDIAAPLARKPLLSLAGSMSFAIARSLALSALVLGPGFILLAAGMTIPGMIWLFLGSFGMMAWTYRKPWRLNLLSCFAPPLAAMACYAVQLALFPTPPPFLWIVVAASVGVGLGYARGAVHTLRREGTEVFAERTLGYLSVWAVGYGASQILAMSATSVLAIRAGLVTGALTTAMLATVCILLLQRRKALLAALVLALPLCVQAPSPATAHPIADRTTRHCITPTALAPGPMAHSDSGCIAHRSCAAAERSIFVKGAPPRAIYVPGDLNAFIAECERAGQITAMTRFLAAFGLSGLLGSGAGSGQVSPLTPQEAAVIAAIAALLLTLSGVLSQVVQAAGEAAAQAGTEEQRRDAERQQEGVRPQNASRSEEDAKTDQRQAEPESRRPTRFPPIFDPYSQTPFETNDKGQYWAPDDKGDWRWLSQREARQAAAAMKDELKGRRAEQQAHEARANQERQTWWDRQQEEAEDSGAAEPQSDGPTWYETMQAREAARAASASEEEYEERLREREQARHDREAQQNMEDEREGRQEEYAREREEEAREKEEREQAQADLRAAEEAATRRGDTDILLRTRPEDVYNPDGSPNLDHIRRVREALRGRMARDLAAPDEDLKDNSWGRIFRETGEGVLDEAQNSFVIRGGLGYFSGGMSEIWFQGRGTVGAIRDAAEKAEDEGREMSMTDGVRIAGQRFAEENLPVETIATAQRIANGEEVSFTEVGMSLLSDAMALVDVAEGVQRGRTLTGQATGKLETMIDQARRGDTGPDLGVGTAADRLDNGRLRPDTEEAIAKVASRDGPRHPVDAHHELGRERGAAKVNALDQAHQRLEQARRDPLTTPEELAQAQRDVRNEVVRVQGDKHAMNEMNARAEKTGRDPLIGVFNEEMNQVYREADEKMRQRLATEYGVRPEDISTVTITNQPGSAGGRISGEAPDRQMGGQASKWTSDGQVENARADRSPVGSSGAADAPAPPATDRKVSFDRDLTMRVRTAPGVFEDIPSTVTARIYNEAVYEAATGRPATSRPAPELGKAPDTGQGSHRAAHDSVDFKDTHLTAEQHLADPLDIDDPQAFARRMDQATTDRLHPEAYGTGQGDLETATMDAMRGRDFTDPAVVAKTVEYKVDHWMGESQRLQQMAREAESPGARQQLLEQASAHMEEAQRQLTKQYRNLVLRRTAAMDALGRVPGARVPTGLAEQIGVLERVRASDPSVRLTPQQAEEVLKSMGTTTQGVARQMSAYVEGLEKLRSPSVQGRPDLSFRRPAMQGWQDDLRGEQQ